MSLIYMIAVRGHVDTSAASGEDRTVDLPTPFPLHFHNEAVRDATAELLAAEGYEFDAYEAEEDSPADCLELVRDYFRNNTP